MKKTLILFISLLSLSISSCKKEEIKEPPITPTPIDENGDCNNLRTTIEPVINRVLTANFLQDGYNPPYTYKWSTGETSGSIGSFSNRLAYDTYWATVTDASGCFSSDTFTIIEPLSTVENTLDCFNHQSAYITINIDVEDGTDLIEKGTCYSTSPNPTIDDTKIEVTQAQESLLYFQTEVTSLNSGTHYYMRAYVTTSAGTGYGEELSFTTQSTASTLQLGDSYQGGIIYKLDCDGLHGAVALDYEVGGAMTWLSAKTYCSNLNVGGYSWTLPKSNEIGLLREHLYISGLYGLSTSSSLYSSYWTDTYMSTGSTTCSSYITYAFNMNQDDGYELNACYSVKFRPIHYF